MATVAGTGHQLSSRGRIDKRHAILQAAFAVFARRGYAGAGVQEIADEAGVAKPTVYNHLVDKDTLFREAITVAAETLTNENLQVIDRLRDARASELRAELSRVVLGLTRICDSAQARALRCLTFGQATAFPDLIHAVRGQTFEKVRDALADRISQLCLTGALQRCDPTTAAEQLLALITGQVEARGGHGTRPVPTRQTRDIAEATIELFLRAYSSHGQSNTTNSSDHEKGNR